MSFITVLYNILLRESNYHIILLSGKLGYHDILMFINSVISKLHDGM